MLSKRDNYFIKENLQRINLGSLQEYYQSEGWRKQKVRHTSRKLFVCHCCQAKEGLELHHMTYERLGDEVFSDLVWLCSECHEQVHLLYVEMLLESKTLEEATNLWRSLCTETAKPATYDRKQKPKFPKLPVLTSPVPFLWRTNPTRTIDQTFG
jgi:hypothetical protein